MDFRRFLTRRAIATAVILVGATAVYSVRLTSPYTYYHENVTAVYSIWMRNYLRFGYSASGLAPIQAYGPDLGSARPQPHQLYSHRTPLVSLLRLP